jgi:hypothetical protein
MKELRWRILPIATALEGTGLALASDVREICLWPRNVKARLRNLT